MQHNRICHYKPNRAKIQSIRQALPGIGLIMHRSKMWEYRIPISNPQTGHWEIRMATHKLTHSLERMERFGILHTTRWDISMGHSRAECRRDWRYTLKSSKRF